MAGTNGWIKKNLGLLLITIIEQKNAWKTAHYSKSVNESLPICYEKSSSSAINKVELFRKGGFKDVSVFKMEEVSDISVKNRTKVPLRYKLTWGNSGANIWYYIRGYKT